MAPKKDSKDRHPSSKPAKSGGGKQKKKKWKQKEKVNNMALLRKRNFSADNNVLICTWRKHWEPRICMQRHPCFLVTCKINGSLARQAIKDSMARGSIRLIAAHASQQIYTDQPTPKLKIFISLTLIFLPSPLRWHFARLWPSSSCTSCIRERFEGLCGKHVQLRAVFLINNIQEQGINGDMAIHVHLELVFPPENLGRTTDIHSGVEHHLTLGDISHKARGVVGQFQAVKSSREVEQLAGAGRLRAGLHLGRAQKRTLVVDGHGGRGVVDRGDVGVGDVYGEGEAGIEDWKVELQRGEVD
ncbi:hypothetical protein K1719_045355 [Acacia pycnantha]|nr:hypothetical protein K1719_045355 [Acacia pycnantha]